MYKLEDYKIEFIEDGHKYFVNGVEKVCLSNILSDVLSNNEPIPKYAYPAMARGTAMHKVIEMDLTTGVDPTSIDEELKGLWESYCQLKEELQLVPEMIEKKIYSPSRDYCFTLDYKGIAQRSHHLIDWKTGEMYPKYQAQLGGQYLGLLDFFPDMAYDNYSLGCGQLFKDGKKGKFHEYLEVEARDDFECIKHVYDIKRRK